ncbi:unnamed protein product, partial [Allacma fusca]
MKDEFLEDLYPEIRTALVTSTELFTVEVPTASEKFTYISSTSEELRSSTSAPEWATIAPVQGVPTL